MTQLKPQDGERAPNPPPHSQAVINPGISQDHAGVMNLLARLRNTDTPSQELAYGCVDWYLYGPETLAAVSH
jgi:hypothetical protein